MIFSIICQAQYILWGMMHIKVQYLFLVVNLSLCGGNTHNGLMGL